MQSCKSGRAFWVEFGFGRDLQNVGLKFRVKIRLSVRFKSELIKK